jgi:predicted enzyme related to lactoylglutathione lyase
MQTEDQIMSDKTYAIGSIVWADLTVPNAEAVRDFYRAVAGWSFMEVAMEDEAGAYADYGMQDQEGNAAAGVCHARGSNAGLPPQWMIYVNVADVDASLAVCRAHGGEVLREQKNDEGATLFAVIRDPAGATMALMRTG